MAKYIRKQHIVEAVQLKHAIRMFVPVGKPIEGAVGDWLVLETNGDQKIISNEEFQRHFEVYQDRKIMYGPPSFTDDYVWNEQKIPPLNSTASKEAMERRLEQDERKLKGEDKEIPKGPGYTRSSMQGLLPDLGKIIIKPTLRDLEDIEQQYKEEQELLEYRRKLYQDRIKDLRDKLDE